MGKQPDGNPWPLDGALDSKLVEASQNRPFAAYVHVPFCTVRCGYCDFNTYTKDFGPGADRATYAHSVLQEIDASRAILQDAGLPRRPLSSIFFGGGTPSLLEPAAIGEVIERLQTSFGIAEGAEITLEVNPETASASRMAGFAEAGVNRVSIGMQSAVPRVLAILDRQHQPWKVGKALEYARAAGLRTSLDLIYGAPTETLDELQQSVDTAVSLDPDHLSVYSLIVEPGTKMAAQIARGELPETDEDLDAQKYHLVDRVLEGAGYSWYEISNFAKTSADRSLHNLAYWRDWDWWGYGPGAHSHIGALRWWNVKHPLAYAARLDQGLSPGFEGEELSDEARHLETVMLGIRTIEGLPAALASPDTLQDLVSEGLLDGAALGGGRIVPTLDGRLLVDYLTRKLLDWE